MLVALAVSFVCSQIVVRPDKDGFLLLDDKEYPQIASQTDPKVLFFYAAEGCTNCDKIKTSLAGLIPELSGNEVPLFLIDCKSAPAACKQRLNNRKPPAVVVQVASKFVVYYGDYNPKSLRDFFTKRLLERRLTVFTPDAFKREIERTKKDQHAILVYRGDSATFRDDFLLPLSRFEPEDAFLVCNSDPICDGLFPKADQDLLFAKAERKTHLSSAAFATFDDLQARFYAFKNIFFIPFGIEFQKKVIEEMSPTVVLFLGRNSDEDANRADLDTFQGVMGGYAKRCYASVIHEERLTNAERRVLAQLKDELGMTSLPRVMVLEADMDTMKLQKYTYPYLDLKPGELQEFLGQWVSGKLQPTKRSQSLRTGEKYQGIPLINHDMFKTEVFVKGRESVVLAHKDFGNDRRSHSFLDFMKRLSKEAEFGGLRWFLVDAELNDLPVFYSKLPSILIFTKNAWENPLVFDKEDFGKLKEVLRKRRELVIDLGGEADEAQTRDHGQQTRDEPAPDTPHGYSDESEL